MSRSARRGSRELTIRVEDGLGTYVPLVLSISADGVRDMYQTGIGAHVDQGECSHRGQCP